MFRANQLALVKKLEKTVDQQFPSVLLLEEFLDMLRYLDQEKELQSSNSNDYRTNSKENNEPVLQSSYDEFNTGVRLISQHDLHTLKRRKATMGN